MKLKTKTKRNLQRLQLLQIIKENMVEDKCLLTNKGLCKGLGISLTPMKAHLKGLIDNGDISIQGYGCSRKMIIPTNN